MCRKKENNLHKTIIFPYIKTKSHDQEITGKCQTCELHNDPIYQDLQTIKP